MILRKRRITVESIQGTRTRKGRHYYFHIFPSVVADTANRLQYLLGDDVKRVAFNQARINSGLEGWNKLFEPIDRQFRTLYRNSKRSRSRPLAEERK